MIYLDAAYAYAFYDPAGSALQVDVPTIRRDLEQLPEAAGSPSQSIKLMDEIEATFPSLQKDFADYRARLVGLPELPPRPQKLELQVQDAVTDNARKYTRIKAPILAIIAVPQQCAPNCDTPGEKARIATQIAQADAFTTGNPLARIVRLAYANHYVFRSNESDVLREMNAFMDSARGP